MPETDNKPRRRTPPKKLPPENMISRTWLVWLALIAAVAGLLMWQAPNQGGTAFLNVSQVVAMAEEGQIQSGSIQYNLTRGPEWAIIRGEATIELPRANAAGTDATTRNFEAEGRLTEDSVIALQQSNKFREVPSTTALTTMLYQILPILLVLAIIYFLFVRQIRQAGRGALNFGKSRAKLLTRDRDRVTFSDVAGCDEAKEEISEVVEFLKDPKKFQKMGGRIPKGILMVGPPGTGKTLLAKAVAGEADVPFFSISGSDFVEMFVGVGASRVRDMFEQGRKNAPCLIFIDEIDAVGRQRGAGLGGGNDEREQTLNSLLVEMDGFDTTEGVIIIAATNRPDVLDNALLRPGRFDRQIYVDLPDLVGREQILRVHARKLSLAESVDLSVIARGTPGLSGAELANLLNESALLAARRNRKKVEMIDVEDAREKVQFGRERRRLMDDEEKKLTAYHEAGHALVQAVLDDGHMPVHKVTIIPRGRSLGSTMFIPKKDVLTHAMKRMLNQIAMGLGGRVAEEEVLGDISSGAAGDIKQVTKIARHMVCDWGMSPLGPVAYGDNQDTVFLGREITRNEHLSEETARKIDNEIHRIIDEQHQRAREIIRERRTALDKIAEALIRHETIEGRHVQEILEFGEIRSPVVVSPAPKNPDDKSGRRPEKPASKSEPIGDSPGAAAPSPA
jgi:cell division protease FtsH